MSETEIWYRYTRYPFLLAKYVLWGLFAYGAIALLSSVEAVLFPVLLSLLIAYLLDPFIDRLEGRGWTRTTAILGFLFTGAGVIGTFLLFLYPTVAHQLDRIGEGAPQLFDQFENQLLPWAETNLGLTVPASFSEAMSSYGETVRAQIPTVGRALRAGITGLWTQLGSVAASVVNLVMIPVFTFYFLRDFDVMRRALVGYLPAANRDFILERARRVDDVVGAWFRGQCEVAGILAVLYAAGLGVVFGFAGIGAGAGIAIGLLAGVLNIIPYFGFLIGFVLAVAMALLDWNGVLPLLGVLAVFAVVQGLEGWVITPRVVGEKVGLSPVIVILALLLGQEVLGLIGILLALPIAGGIRVLMPDFVAFWRASSWYTGRVEDAPLTFVQIAEAAEAERKAAAAARAPAGS